MILPIYTYGQPVLRQEAEEIGEDYPDLAGLIQNMYDTLERSEGIGLAAPQVGLPIRLVVINLDNTSYDSKAALTISGKIGEILGKIKL